MLIQQRRLLHHHLRRHLHQLGIGAHLGRLAGDADHPHPLIAKAERQVDAGPHALQVFGGGAVDFHHPVLRQRQHRAFMTLEQALRVAGGDDHAVAVHHVDGMADDAHRPLDDLARGGFRQKIGLSEHARLPAEGENAGLLYAIWRGRLTGTAATSCRDHNLAGKRQKKTPDHRPGVMHSQFAINRG